MKNTFPIILIFFAALSGCIKHSLEEELPPLPTATVTFLRPAPGDVFHSGDSINIKATVTSTAELHGYDLLIRKAGEASNYFFVHIHDHGDTVHIDQNWKDTLTSPANLEAELSIYLDHEGHTQKTKVSFASQ